MVSPEAVLGAVETVAGAVKEGFKWAQTSEGQAVAKEWRENTVAFRQGVADLLTWAKGVGEVFKPEGGR